MGLQEESDKMLEYNPTVFALCLEHETLEEKGSMVKVLPWRLLCGDLSLSHILSQVLSSIPA